MWGQPVLLSAGNRKGFPYIDIICDKGIPKWHDIASPYPAKNVLTFYSCILI